MENSKKQQQSQFRRQDNDSISLKNIKPNESLHQETKSGLALASSSATTALIKTANESNNNPQISVEPTQVVPLAQLERQHTPGAADSAAPRCHSASSLQERGAVDTEDQAMVDEQARQGQNERSNSQPPTSTHAIIQDLNPEQALNLTDDDVESLRRLLTEHNLPLNNPVLIVEVLVEKQTQQDEDEGNQKMKFTFAKEDLMEVFGQFGRVVEVELFDEDECAYVTFQDFFEAWYAQQSLNGQYLSNAKVNLLVKWLPDSGQQQASIAAAVDSIQAQAPGLIQRSGSGSFEQMSTDRPEFQPSGKTPGTQLSATASASQQARPQSSGGHQPLKPQSLNQSSANLAAVERTDQVANAQTSMPQAYMTNTHGASNSGLLSQKLGQMGASVPAKLLPPTKFEQENIHSSAFTPQFQTSSSNFVPTITQQTMGFQGQNGAGNMMQGCDDQSQNGSGGETKYTCRYDIQIPNEREFQVARRLIGAKGCNMKRIISQCSKNMPQVTEVVKLRLRGKGSGFKEGPKQEESKEPLHLCISSRFYNQYMLACQQIEQLLLNVYEEFKKHCERTRKDIRSTNGGGILQIKKFETVTGRRTQVQQMHNTYQVNTTTQGQQQSQQQNNSYTNAQNVQQFMPSNNTQQQQQSMAHQVSGNQEEQNQTFGHFVPMGSSSYMPMQMPMPMQSKPHQQH